MKTANVIVPSRNNLPMQNVDDMLLTSILLDVQTRRQSYLLITRSQPRQQRYLSTLLV